MSGLGRKLLSCVTFTILSASSLSTLANGSAPFGLKWGATVEEVKAMGVSLTPTDEQQNLTMYQTGSLPKNISIKERYALIFSDEYNLQKVVMNSTSFQEDPIGTEGKETYNKFKNLLMKKYGTPTTEYEVVGATLYKDNDEFYQCLAYSGCGMWVTIFESKSPEPITILLQIEGQGRGRGYLKLGYEGPKWAASLKAKEASEKANDAGAL